MVAYHILALLVFLIVVAALLIRYVDRTVDREFRNLARATSDAEYRQDELLRADRLLEDRLPLPDDVGPVPGPAKGWSRALPFVLSAIGVILLWGGLFAREERGTWLYAGVALLLLSAGILLATLERRKWERLARLLRFRADLRRMDGKRAAAAADLRELLRLTPWDDAAWAELADDLAAEGDLDAALEAVRQAIRLDQRYDEYRMLEASLCLRLFRLDQAREALADWAGLDGIGPDDPRVIIYRAALELAGGNRERATSSLGKLQLEEEHSFEFLDNDQALEGLRDLLPCCRSGHQGGNCEARMRSGEGKADL